jgi:hypothetical protein
LIPQKEGPPSTLISTDDRKKLKKDSSKEDEVIFILGAKKFTEFVANPEKALFLSRYINQHLIATPFNKLFLENSPFFLPEVGLGNPLGGIKEKLTLSKSKDIDGDFILHYEQNQTPDFFQFANSYLPLNKTSFVNRSCDITFKASGSIEVSPIGYQYHLKKAPAP